MRHTHILTSAVLLAAVTLSPSAPAQHPQASIAQKQRARLTTQLNSLRLNRIQFNEATAEEAITLLQIKAKEADPAKTGVNIMLKLPDDEKKALPRISLNLTDVPLGEALRYVAQLSNLIAQVEAHAVTLTSATYASTTLASRTYNVPPDFLKAAQALK
jgi:general secretion pathway protein D